MSLYNTRTVGDVKVVMLKGQDGTGSIPSGGTAGQVLTKSGDADYEVIWSTLKKSRAVELSETNIQTEVGTAKTVTVKYRVAGISDTATYTSSDTGVATVAVTGHSSTGTSATDVITITPVANGDCTIKIAFANEVGYDAEYDYINVTVGAAMLHQPYKVSVYNGSSTGTTKYYKVIEKVIGDPAAMVNPVHLSGTIGTWGYAKKAIFDIEIDFRSAENSVISICGVISKKWTDYADIVATYDSSTTTIRIYVKLEAGWNFADFASNFETIASPTVESSTTGSVTKLMSASDVVNLDQKASTSAFGFAKVDGTTIISNNGVLSAASGGSSIKKTRYTISSSSWSASANASGYYTYSVTLNPTLKTTYAPEILCTGADDSTLPTNIQRSMYRLLSYIDNTAINTLILYAKVKPTSTFYIWVKGEKA